MGELGGPLDYWGTVEWDVIQRINRVKPLEIYKTKEILNRKITVCVFVNGNSAVTAGYSVTHPDDEFKKDIAEIISKGRAMKPKTNVLSPMTLGEGMDKKYILYALADKVFRDIENGLITIKGIK